MRFILIGLCGVVLSEIICRDTRGQVRWFSGQKCPSYMKPVNMSKLANFKLNFPLLYVSLTGSTSENFSASGVEYFSVFGNSELGSTPKGSVRNVFKCKDFKVYIETTYPSGCNSNSVRRFRLWDPSQNAPIGLGKIDLTPGAGKFFSTATAKPPNYLVIQTEGITGNCPNKARWILFCK
ncbi:MAG: hypothetical protein N2654_00250 [Deltaproteobacteria bacterium]|nr:hypothetical protein [Deltaproteobacteria bacterium]